MIRWTPVLIPTHLAAASSSAFVTPSGSLLPDAKSPPPFLTIMASASAPFCARAPGERGGVIMIMITIMAK